MGSYVNMKNVVALTLIYGLVAFFGIEIGLVESELFTSLMDMSVSSGGFINTVKSLGGWFVGFLGFPAFIFISELPALLKIFVLSISVATYYMILSILIDLTESVIPF